MNEHAPTAPTQPEEPPKAVSFDTLSDKDLEDADKHLHEQFDAQILSTPAEITATSYDDLNPLEKDYADKDLFERFDKEELAAAAQDLGEEAVEATVENPVEGAEKAEDAPFKPGQAVIAYRNTYTDGKVDPNKPGRFEKGWTVESINDDGSYTIANPNARHNNGDIGVKKVISREQLENWQKTNAEQDREAQSMAAIAEFNAKLNNNPANLDPNNLPEHTPVSPEVAKVNNEFAGWIRDFKVDSVPEPTPKAPASDPEALTSPPSPEAEPATPEASAPTTPEKTKRKSLRERWKERRERRRQKSAESKKNKAERKALKKSLKEQARQGGEHREDEDTAPATEIIPQESTEQASKSQPEDPATEPIPIIDPETVQIPVADTEVIPVKIKKNIIGKALRKFTALYGNQKTLAEAIRDDQIRNMKKHEERIKEQNSKDATLAAEALGERTPIAEDEDNEKKAA